MRTEAEMMALILEIAQADARVRAVGMNGSRVNPHVPRDRYQDYDIVYLVTDMASFLADPSWVDVFGERVMLQMPEAGTLFPPSLGGWFTYLMQFADGNRIDLMLIPTEDAAAYAANDSLTVVLLDKDGLLPALPPPDDSAHHVKRPPASHFAECCNEFFWVSAYVAKGLCRREPLYALHHLSLMREELLRMLGWQVGLAQGFAVSVGKCGKYLDRYLPAETWDALLATYTTAQPAACRNALFGMMALFRKAAKRVADGLGACYPQGDDARMTAYVTRLLDNAAVGLPAAVRALPPEAYPGALQLAREGFTRYVAPDCTPAGEAAFFQFLDSKEETETLQFWGATDNGQLVGMLAMRGSHLCLFFVAPSHHRRGIGRALYRHMVAQTGCIEVTVHASPYAQEAYRHLGFTETGPMQTADGIRYLPMVHRLT